VEPRGHVEGAVVGGEGEMHDHVVGAHHLDRVVQRDALRQPGRPRGVEAGRLAVEVAVGVRRRGRVAREELVEVLADHRGPAWLVGREAERLAGTRRELRVEDERRRARVVDHVRGFAGREAEVDRRRDRPEPQRSQPAERELGPVEELEDDRLAGPHAARRELPRQPLDVAPELRVGPTALALGLAQRGPVGEAPGIAGDPGEVAEIALEDAAEGGRVVLVQGLVFLAPNSIAQ
jgi:hypothetical protein